MESVSGLRGWKRIFLSPCCPDGKTPEKDADKQSVVKRYFQGRKTCDDSPLAYRKPFAWKGKTFGTACPDGMRRKPLRHLNLKGNVSEPSSLKPVHPGGRLHSSSTKDCSAPRGQGNASPSPVCNGLLIRWLPDMLPVRNYGLDLLRILLCLTVVFFHYSGGWNCGGSVAVDGFFVLSGFLAVWSAGGFTQGSIGEYCRKKADACCRCC